MRNVRLSATAAPAMTAPDAMPFEIALEARARAVEASLREVLDARLRPGEIARPERLLAAMRHGAMRKRTPDYRSGAHAPASAGAL